MNQQRIVSLLPGATEMVFALGLGNCLVGRSHECDYPPKAQALPVCSRPQRSFEGSSLEVDKLVHQDLAAAVSIFSVDLQILRDLHPTHILTQTLCNVCAVSVADVESCLSKEQGLLATVVSLGASSVQGVWDDLRRIAQAFDKTEVAEHLIGGYMNDMDSMAELVSLSHSRPTVAVVEWIEPLMTAGNWIPELIQKAGGSNLFGHPGEHSPYLDWEELTRSNPERIIVAPCGFGLSRTRDEMPALASRNGWEDLRAVRSGQVFLFDANQFLSRPGPRLVQSLRILCEIIQPALFPPIHCHSGWEHY